MKLIALLPLLILISGCANPAMDPIASGPEGRDLPAQSTKELSPADCVPLALPSTGNDGEEMDETMKIVTASADLFIDASESDATVCATDMGLSVRIAERDGEGFMLTMDFVPTRINFSVNEGVVTAASVG